MFIGDEVWPLGFNFETGASATIQNICFLPSGVIEIAVITEDNTLLHVQPCGVVKWCAIAKVSGISFPLLSLLFKCEGVLVHVMWPVYKTDCIVSHVNAQQCACMSDHDTVDTEEHLAPAVGLRRREAAPGRLSLERMMCLSTYNC